jgi:hypothetical protein
MIFGWIPKSLKSNGPVPLKYWNRDFPASQGGLKTVYFGYCPKDSYSMHSEFKAKDPAYSYDFSNPLSSAYAFISRKYNRLPDSRPFTGMAPDCPQESLHFDSFFECGNLDRAVMVSRDEYDLYVRPDSNSGGHFQWFYFKVSNVQSPRQVRFNILNLARKRSLYDSGKRPYSATQSGGQWRPSGKNIQYGPSKINRLFISTRRYYCLSFDFKLSDSNEVYMFAELPPYSLTKQLSFLRELQATSCEGCTVRLDTLCYSLSGLEVPLVTISDLRFPSVTKQIMLIVGRVHPGEVVASLIIEGMLRYLSSSDPDAVIMRQRLEIRVVPMLNPDGVVMGNSRTSISGSDLNRRYLKPDPQAHVEVWSLKELISAQRDKMFAFIDVHGHSTKKGAFLYGPQFALHNDQYYLSRVVPKLMSEQTEMFRYFSCKFRVSKPKRRAARAVVAKEFGVAYSYTFENSFHCYLNEQRQTVMLTQTDYLYLGELLIKALSEFDILLELDQIRAEERSNIRAHKKGHKVERQDRPVRKRPKRSGIAGSQIKLRSVAELIKQIKAEEPHLEVESSGSDTDSSEEEEEVYDLNFIRQALSEVSMVFEHRGRRTPIRVVELEASNRTNSKSNLDIRLPSLQPSPTKEQESPDLQRTPSSKPGICRVRYKTRQSRLPSRQLVPSQTVTYPILQIPIAVSSLQVPNLRANKRHKNSLNKLKRILRKMGPRTSTNSSLHPKTPMMLTPVNRSFTVLQLQDQNPLENLPSQKSQVLRKTLKRDKSASLYSKFGPFPALPLMFQ